MSAELSLAGAQGRGGKVVGRVVGREGGKVTITLPVNVDKARVKVTFGGKDGIAANAAATIDGNNISFSFEIKQSEGVKDYAVAF